LSLWEGQVFKYDLIQRLERFRLCNEKGPVTRAFNFTNARQGRAMSNLA